MAAVDADVVRQLATEHILEDARRAHDVGAAVLGHFGPDALTKHEYGAYCSAIREAIKTATLIVGWPNAGDDTSMPAGRVGAWTDAIRRLPADQHTPMPLDILGDLVAVVSEHCMLVDHFVECPTLAGDDPYALAACRVCGCTEAAACDGGCSWVPDPWQGGHLCSTCLPADPATLFALPSEAEMAKAHTFLAERREDIESYHERFPGQPGCSCGRALGCDGGASDLEPVGILQDLLGWAIGTPIATSADDDARCECGCQPGQLCGCGLEDCECIGNCAVCDAPGVEYAIAKDMA